MRASHTRACPACGHRGARVALATAGREQLRCNDCGTVFTAEVGLADDPADAASDEPGRTSRQRTVADARAAILRKFGCRAVLEVGCGAGVFLDAVRDLGMQVEGLDARPDPDVLARGHIVHPALPDAPRFDAVTLWDVLGHAPDPKDMLLQTRRWLRPGGFLALSTASSGGVPARMLGPRIAVTDPAPAIVFSRRGLKLLLAAAGFDPVRWTTSSGLGRELLQHGLERRWLGASLPGRALAHGLAIAAQLPLRVIDRAGLGSAFEVYAVAGRD